MPFGPGRLLAALSAFVVLTLVCAVGPVLPASAYCGSLCPSANTPMLGSIAAGGGVSLAEGVVSSGALAAGSAAAPVATASLTSGALATGGTGSVWGVAAGGIGVLLGGIAAWRWIMPGESDPGLPAGGGGGSVTGWPGVVGMSGLTLTAQGVSGTWWRAVTTYNGTCWGSWSGGGVTRAQVYGNASSWSSAGFSWSVPASSGSLTGVVCAATLDGAQPPEPVAGQLGTYEPTGQAGLLVRIGSFGTGGAPSRTIEQTVTCKRADGSVSTVTNVGSSGVWAAGAMVEVAGLMCPSGSRAVGVSATVKTPGGDDVALLPGAPGSVDSGLDALTSNIPEPCYTGTGGCTLRLERATRSGEWELTNGAESPGWAADPGAAVGEVGLVIGSQPKTVGTYRCTYGSPGNLIGVPISECGIYAPATGELAAPGTSGYVQPGATDPTGDCEFGWSDLLTGGILVRGGMCVLRWAFTPTPGTVEGLKAQLETRAPFTVASEAADGAGAMVDAYTGAASCGVIADFTTDDIAGRIECDAFSKIPGASALRSLVGVVLVALTGLYLFKLAASSVGAES